jgi:hypothetical protein
LLRTSITAFVSRQIIHRKFCALAAGGLLSSFRHEWLIEIFIKLGEPALHIEDLINRFKQHAASDTAHAHLVSWHAEFLRQTHGLTASVLEQLCGLVFVHALVSICR